MGMRAKEKCRSSLFASENSLPDKLTHALKHLRPGALVHSASGSAPFRMKARGAVAADDVVYISAPEPRVQRRDVTTRSDPDKRRHHSVLMPSACGSPEARRENALKDLDHIRSLYKSVPNVSTLEDNDMRFRPSKYSSRFMDEYEATSSSTRSPTDSGYRSTPRYTKEENPYALDDEDDADSGVSRKTTTVVHVNGPSPSSGPVIRMQNRVADWSHSPRRRLTALPFTENDVVFLLQNGKCKSYAKLLDVATVPRLNELLLDALHAIAEVISHVSFNAFKLTHRDVLTAIKIIYPLEIWALCSKAANAAREAYTSHQGTLNKTMSDQSNLYLNVGHIYRWLLEFFPTKPIHEIVAVVTSACLECLLEQVFQTLFQFHDSSRVLLLSDFESKVGEISNIAEILKKDESEHSHDCQTLSSLRNSVEEIRRSHMTILEKHSSTKSERMQMSPTASRSLHYYLNNFTQSGYTLSDWIRIAFAHAENRYSIAVEECDIQQSARLILGLECCPPPSTIVANKRNDLDDAVKAFAYDLLSSGVKENICYAFKLLREEIHTPNSSGMNLVSMAARNGDHDALKLLISSGCALNAGLLPVDQDPCSLMDFAGWTPLCWAVAGGHTDCMDLLLNSGAELQNDSMITETPLQIAVQLGDPAIVERLLSCSADPLKSGTDTEFPTPSVFCSSPSPIALSAARGDTATIKLLLSPRQTSSSEQTSRSKREFSDFSPSEQFALNEALYYSIETGRPHIASFLMKEISGLPWTLFSWTRAVQHAAESDDDQGLATLFSSFGPKLATELTDENIDFSLTSLFSIVRHECRRTGGHAAGACFAISRLWHYFNPYKLSKQPIEARKAISPRTAIIDASFVNNENLSDVRFQVDGEIIYGHRIVLINLSEKFRSLLQSSKGVIDITGVSHSQFLAIMKFAYTGILPDMDVSSLISLYPSSEIFGINSLKSAIEVNLANCLSPAVVGDVYQFALVHTIPNLLETCERFVLEHFETVIAYQKMRELLAHSADDDVCTSLSNRLRSAFYATKTRQSAKA